jgi:hypothetical protein
MGRKAFHRSSTSLPNPYHGEFSPATEQLPQVPKPRTHPFLLAKLWRQQMDRDARLPKARIAAREGISRARVTQVMNL